MITIPEEMITTHLLILITPLDLFYIISQIILFTFSKRNDQIDMLLCFIVSEIERKEDR